MTTTATTASPTSTPALHTHLSTMVSGFSNESSPIPTPTPVALTPTLLPMTTTTAAAAAAAATAAANVAKNPDILDCAICLDNIRPKHHAKAILACRHEFHLSCISVAFSMGNKEMICPLCRFLHKDQPFMGSDAEDTKPPHIVAAAAIATANHTLSINTTPSMTSAIRNRHRTNSIHLQHNLSNMVQHQQRRQSIYELRRASVSSPTTATAAANAISNSGSITSTAASLPSSSLPSSTSSPSPSSTYTQQRQSSAATPRHHRAAPVKVTSFPNMTFYGLPSFSIAVLLMAFVLGQVDTLWSKISCLTGSMVFYVLCWVFVVQIIAPSAQDYQQQRDAYFQDQAAAAAAATVAMVSMITPTGMTTTSSPTSVYNNNHEHAFNGMSISNAMEYEFEVQGSFTPTDISANYATYYNQIGNPHPAVLHQQQLQRERQHLLQQQRQQQQQEQQQQQQSSSSSARIPFCSVAQWVMSSQYAQNLVRRITDLVEIMDDYSETLGHW